MLDIVDPDTDPGTFTKSEPPKNQTLAKKSFLTVSRVLISNIKRFCILNS